MKIYKVTHDKQDHYFRYKAQAKQFRDNNKGTYVARGPDHWKGET